MKALLLLLLATAAQAILLPAPVDVVKSVPLSISTGTFNIGTISGSSVTVYQGGAPWSVTGSTVIIASQIALSSGTNQIGTVSGSSVSIPGGINYSPSYLLVITSATVTASDIIVLAADPLRKAVECKTDCTNNKSLHLKFNASAASGAVEILEPCVSWQPPPGVAVTAALHFYAPIGSQVVRCTEYP